MKFLLVALATFTLYAQNAKIDPASLPKTEEPKLEGRTLSESEVLKFQLLAAKIQLLGDKYKIAEYQQEAAPLASDQQALMTETCKSVGVAQEKIQSECALDLGLGPDGKPRLGPDNKPVTPRVWKAQPQPTPPAKK